MTWYADLCVNDALKNILQTLKYNRNRGLSIRLIHIPVSNKLIKHKQKTYNYYRVFPEFSNPWWLDFIIPIRIKTVWLVVQKLTIPKMLLFLNEKCTYNRKNTLK